MLSPWWLLLMEAPFVSPGVGIGIPEGQGLGPTSSSTKGLFQSVLDDVCTLTVSRDLTRLPFCSPHQVLEC